MRPFKHAAPTQSSNERPEFQNILGISLTRLAAPWGEVPIVATGERDRITLLYWDDRAGRWEAAERPHEPITSDGSSPDEPPNWNWSDRVGLASAPSTVFLVYKRQVALDQPPRLIVDRFGVEDPSGASRGLRLIDTVPIGNVGMLTNPLGRSLWCGFDQARETLLVLCQLLREGRWHLRLLQFSVAASPWPPLDPPSTAIGEGGFEVDACIHGRTLLVVHRRTPEALRVPFVSLLGLGTLFESGPQADAHYEPLQLASIDLDTLDVTSEAIPGGAHPQIQRAEPLLVTFDRHQRTSAQLDTPIIPLPPRRPRAIWTQRRVDKIAWLRQGGSASRGVLLTFDSVVPRSHADISSSVHLFDVQQGLLAHATAFAFCPVWAMQVEATRTDLTLDMLHHREHVGVFRTRVTATLAGGAINVTGSRFEVWDIGHGRIRNPTDLVPDASGENSQFEPIGGQAVSRSPFTAVRGSAVDNTIGGHVAADLSYEPGGFFAYTDLGDGGLRVTFAQKRPALPEPPPIDDEKVLTAPQVTGPQLRCEEWVELRAADWSPSELPAYPAGITRTTASLGSTLEVPIEFLLDAATTIRRDDGTPLLPLEGLSDEDLNLIDENRLELAAPRQQLLTANDGRAVLVTITPEVPVDGIEFQINASVDGVAIPVFWTFQPLSTGAFVPAGPLPPGTPGTLDMTTATTNPTAVTLRIVGTWRVSLFLMDGPAAALPAVPAVAFDLVINASVRTLIWALHGAIGATRDYRARQLTVSILQYVIDYRLEEVGNNHLDVAIRVLPQRATELKFLGGGAEQGAVDYRATIVASSTAMELTGIPRLLFAVREFSIAFAYGRPFTCGMLMRDQRSADVLTGDDLGDAPFDVVRRTDPLRHAAIGGKPIGESSTSAPELGFRLETTLGAVTLGTVVGALAVFGLFSLASTIAFFFQFVALAAALGVAGAILAVVAAAVLVYLLIEVLPRAVEAGVKAEVDRQFEDNVVRDSLDDQGMLRYAGEGMAEAIARKALQEAVDRGLAIAPPADTGDSLGFDRFRGQTFQIVFVTEGTCRILLRLDRCEDDGVLPDPPEGPDDDDDGPVIVPG